MSEEWFRDFDRRRSQRATRLWRSHNQSAGRKQLIAGSVAALVAAGLLVSGMNQYIDATYAESGMDPAPGITMVVVACALLAGSAILAGIGLIKQHRDLKNARTYGDHG